MIFNIVYHTPETIGEDTVSNGDGISIEVQMAWGGSSTYNFQVRHDWWGELAVAESKAADDSCALWSTFAFEGIRTALPPMHVAGPLACSIPSVFAPRLALFTYVCVFLLTPGLPQSIARKSFPRAASSFG